MSIAPTTSAQTNASSDEHAGRCRRGRRARAAAEIDGRGGRLLGRGGLGASPSGRCAHAPRLRRASRPSAARSARRSASGGDLADDPAAVHDARSGRPGRAPRPARSRPARRRRRGRARARSAGARTPSSRRPGRGSAGRRSAAAAGATARGPARPSAGCRRTACPPRVGVELVRTSNSSTRCVGVALDLAQVQRRRARRTAGWS